MERPNWSRDLFEVSRSLGALNEAVVKIIMRQVCQTVSEMQALGVFHRDLKDTI